MTDQPKPKVGTIGWHDLTSGKADEVRDFYKGVVGWTHSEVDMGGYSDYTMLTSDGEEAAGGVCHARGTNADVPPQWIMYVIVEDIDESVRQCNERGGKVIVGPKSMGEARYCIIQDPAGAVCGLYQP